MKALIITANDFEDMEVFYPYYRLLEEGIEVEIVSDDSQKIKGKHGYEITIEKKIDDINPEDYELLILPGGKAPSKLRENEKILNFVKSFNSHKKLIAAICHGPQILAKADLIRGRKLTGYRNIKKEIEEAGGLYEDREVVIDGNLITSRKPSDLPYFMREILKKFKEKSNLLNF